MLNDLLYIQQVCVTGCAYPTIYDALAAVNQNDTLVLVAEGYYSEYGFSTVNHNNLTIRYAVMC